MTQTDARPSRRTIHFDTIDDALAHAELLVDSERAGRLARAGNWPLGRTLGHLATWADFAFDGYPPAVSAPLPVRWIARLLKNRILTRGMMPGVKVGRVPGGTLGTEPLNAVEGLARLRVAWARLRDGTPTVPNPIFGPLTHDEWVRLNLRHAELHLSFQVPGDEGGVRRAADTDATGVT